MPEHRGHRLKGVYAARTTEASQPRLEFFLKRLAKHLGAAATVRHIASTHVTLLESFGVKDQFYNYDFTAHDVRLFSKRMQRRIDKSGSNQSHLSVRVDPHEPLRWVGCVGVNSEPTIGPDGKALKPYKFAIGLASDQRLDDQRGIIEEGLKEEFGELPEMRLFSPHITIGTIERPWREQYCENEATALLPPGLSVPRAVALNGLAVYLDRIHERDAVIS